MRLGGVPADVHAHVLNDDKKVITKEPDVSLAELDPVLDDAEDEDESQPDVDEDVGNVEELGLVEKVGKHHDVVNSDDPSEVVGEELEKDDDGKHANENEEEPPGK